MRDHDASYIHYISTTYFFDIHSFNSHSLMLFAQMTMGARCLCGLLFLIKTWEVHLVQEIGKGSTANVQCTFTNNLFFLAALAARYLPVLPRNLCRMSPHNLFTHSIMIHYPEEKLFGNNTQQKGASQGQTGQRR